MPCPKLVLLYSVLLTVLLDPTSGKRRATVLSQKNYEGTPYVGGHGIISYDKNYKNKYQYNPPKSLVYSHDRGRELVVFPVYHGPLPEYVYKYKASGSKYGTLLTGLALLNLGALGPSAYSHLKSSRRNPPPSEECIFEVKKGNDINEKTKIDCQIISSFLVQNTSINTTKLVTKKPVHYTTRSMMQKPARRRKPIVVEYEMLSNGTLVVVQHVPVILDVPMEVTTAFRELEGGSSQNVTENVTDADNTTVGTTSSDNDSTNEPLENALGEKENYLKKGRNATLKSALGVKGKDPKTITTLKNALDVKGTDIKVTPEMQCFVSRTSPTSGMKKSVPCDLLQAYSDKSIKALKSAAYNTRTLGLIATIVIVPCFEAF